MRETTVFAPVDFTTRFPALDGIRALAISMVFLEHYGGGGTHGGRVLQIFNNLRIWGGTGVNLFFVLSGFLITGILFDTRHDSRFFTRFFARRSVRIFPVYYLMFAILALLTLVFHYQWRPGHALFLVYLGNIFANADFTLYELHSANHPAASATLSHLWSLCVEEQFYLIWPLIVFFVKDRKKLIWICIAIALATLSLRTFAVLTWQPETYERWLGRTLPFQIDSMLYGALLALLLRTPAAARVQAAMKWVFLASFLLLLLVCWGVSPFSPIVQSLGYTLLDLTGLGLIGMVLLPNSTPCRAFSLRPLRFLGKYSYGFYLWHLLFSSFWIRVLVFFTRTLHSTVLGGLVTLPLCFAVVLLWSKLSYDLFEVRFLKLKRHFEYDSELATHKTAFAPDGN